VTLCAERRVAPKKIRRLAAEQLEALEQLVLIRPITRAARHARDLVHDVLPATTRVDRFDARRANGPRFWHLIAGLGRSVWSTHNVKSERKHAAYRVPWYVAHMGRWLLPSIVLYILLAASCGSDSDSSARACTPGESKACTAPGGCQGGQVCKNDGSGFSA
jgi:hypothetical protein